MKDETTSIGAAMLGLGDPERAGHQLAQAMEGLGAWGAKEAAAHRAEGRRPGRRESQGRPGPRRAPVLEAQQDAAVAEADRPGSTLILTGEIPPDLAAQPVAPAIQALAADSEVP